MDTGINEELRTLTTQLKRALEEQAAAKIALMRLENETDMVDEEIPHRGGSFAARRLRLRIEEAEGKAELEHRSTYAKATIGSASSAVNSDPTVIRLRGELLDLEEKEFLKGVVTPETETSTKLLKAQERLIMADVGVTTVMQALETYRVLVASRADR